MPGQFSLRRGDVVLVPFPNSDLETTKLRPALVIQSNSLDSEIPQHIVAMISSNRRRAGRPQRVLITNDSPNGPASGLLFESVVMADNVATVLSSRVSRVIGHLRDMSEIDEALRHALDL